jgi:hypothetical protein
MNVDIRKLALIIVVFFLAHVILSASLDNEEPQNTKKTYPTPKIAEAQIK